jgi:cysteinyl-tRNA synthetase
MNFTWEGMDEARQALARIDGWLLRLRETAGANVVGTPRRGVRSAQRADPTSQFEEALDDDLNISAALGFLFESIRETNRAMDRNELDAASANAWLNWWKRINSVLDLERETDELPAAVAQLADERERARLAKKWKTSDELRDRIAALGWEVRDTKDGQKLTRCSGAQSG